MILDKIVYEDDLWLAEDGDTIILGKDFDDCKAGERCTIINIDVEHDSNGDPELLYLRVKNNLGFTAWIDCDNNDDDITLFRKVKI